MTHQEFKPSVLEYECDAFGGPVNSTLNGHPIILKRVEIDHRSEEYGEVIITLAGCKVIINGEAK